MAIKIISFQLYLNVGDRSKGCFIRDLSSVWQVHVHEGHDFTVELKEKVKHQIIAFIVSLPIKLLPFHAQCKAARTDC